MENSVLAKSERWTPNQNNQNLQLPLDAVSYDCWLNKTGDLVADSENIAQRLVAFAKQSGGLSEGVDFDFLYMKW